jgi:hypothetical protein
MLMTNKPSFESRLKKADEEIERLNSMYDDFSKEKKKYQDGRWVHDVKGKIKNYNNNLESGRKAAGYTFITAALSNLFYLGIFRPDITPGGEKTALDLLFLSTLGVPIYFGHILKKQAKKMENEIKSEIGVDNFEEKIRRIEEKNTSVYYR